MEESLDALMKHPRFARLIKKHGPPKLRRGKNAFQALARAIFYQQISGKAAASIYRKFVALFGITLPEGSIDWEKPSVRKFPTPEEVLKMPETKLRSAGLSAQKISYLKDLAEKFTDGSIQERRFAKMPSDDIIAHLTAVKGIGVWTAHMFLIFTLNRPDILPIGDLGIRKGFQILYSLEMLPSPKEMERLAEPWREHASVASWYLWRLADEAK